MPEALGKYVVIKFYMNENHAGNMVNRWQHSGIIIYINNLPITWDTKCNNTVQDSIFGSYFIALGITTEIIDSLWYKLRCFGVPVNGTADVFCDNKSVVNNLCILASVLNKRHNYICYHRVRQDKAGGVLCVRWIPGDFNLDYLFTKTTMPGNTRHTLVEPIFSNIASPIGGIEKAQVHLHTVAYK